MAPERARVFAVLATRMVLPTLGVRPMLRCSSPVRTDCRVVTAVAARLDCAKPPDWAAPDATVSTTPVEV